MFSSTPGCEFFAENTSFGECTDMANLTLEPWKKRTLNNVRLFKQQFSDNFWNISASHGILGSNT